MGCDEVDVVRLARPKGKNVADKMIVFRSAKEEVIILCNHEAEMKIFFQKSWQRHFYK